MKKSIVFVLILVLLASAAFAGGGSNRAASGSGVQVDVFWYMFGDTYLTSVRNNMAAEFSSYSAFRVTHHDCNNSQTTQTQMIQTAITQGTKLLIVNIVTTGSEEAAMNIVDMARRANVPIIFFNREVSNAVIRSYANAAFVGTDADEAGVMQGQAIANFLLRPENWSGNNSRFDLNRDGRINYVMLRGEHGNAEALGRTKYAVQEANRLLSGRLTLAPSPANQTSTQYENDGISNFFLYANWSAAEAANLMRTALAAHSLTNGSIELVAANNDDAALGAIEAMNEQGFNTGRQGAGYIPVFGVDATTVAVEAIRSGRMTGTVLQDALGMARTIVALAQNIANNQPVFSNTSTYNVDQGVNKIRVPYAIVE
ncbi:MAG: galactose ABC transporter substrate-binding protein [Treponema sp.]|nr:galactose ABC transporter substrate-binding protein [Treponema sp.]